LKGYQYGTGPGVDPDEAKRVQEQQTALDTLIQNLQTELNAAQDRLNYRLTMPRGYSGTPDAMGRYPAGPKGNLVPFSGQAPYPPKKPRAAAASAPFAATGYWNEWFQTALSQMAPDAFGALFPGGGGIMSTLPTTRQRMGPRTGGIAGFLPWTQGFGTMMARQGPYNEFFQLEQLAGQRGMWGQLRGAFGQDQASQLLGMALGGGRGLGGAVGGIAGSAFGGIGGILGGFVGGGIERTLRGVFKKHHRDGSTPAQAIFVDAPKLEDKLDQMLNISKVAILQGAGRGYTAMMSNAALQAERAGVH